MDNSASNSKDFCGRTNEKSSFITAVMPVLKWWLLIIVRLER